MANNQSAQNPIPVPTGSDANCKLGRRAIHVTIDFSLGAKYNLDMSQIQSLGVFDCAQTLYIDNSNNTDALTITCGLTLQSLIVPAGTQAYLPILQPNPPIIQFSNGAAANKVDIQILNFFVPPFMWWPTGMPIVDNTLAPLISNGGLNVNTTPVVITGPTDKSGAIVATGVPQLAIAANAARKRFIVSNPTTSGGVLQISFGAGANGKIDLAVGTSWDESGSTISGDAIYVTGTIAQPFTAYEW